MKLKSAQKLTVGTGDVGWLNDLNLTSGRRRRAAGRPGMVGEHDRISKNFELTSSVTMVITMLT